MEALLAVEEEKGLNGGRERLMGSRVRADEGKSPPLPGPVSRGLALDTIVGSSV